MKKFDMVFLGRIFPKKDKNIKKYCVKNMQDAADVLQWNILEGLVLNEQKNITAISYLPIDSWPKAYKKAFIPSVKENYKNEIYYKSVSFCNITIIKQLLNKKICNKEVSKWVKRRSSKKKVIICYSCNSTLMEAVKKAKMMDENIIAIQVIADIPQYATNDMDKGIRRIYTRRCCIKEKKLRKFIDAYVLLTERMSQKLEISKPYVVMEGIAEQRTINAKVTSTSEGKTILYGGSLNIKYGILHLLDAFSLIKGVEYKLVICGLGNAEEEIKAREELDKRIKFMGKIDHEELLKLQRTATVLVNPRQNIEEFTKYSFPSKNLEYLSSGVPLVAYKLDGIPDEYDDYIIYPKSNSVEDLAKCIQSVCELSIEERKALGDKAKRFVLENKNSIVQTRKILDLIENIS